MLRFYIPCSTCFVALCTILLPLVPLCSVWREPEALEKSEPDWRRYVIYSERRNGTEPRTPLWFYAMHFNRGFNVAALAARFEDQPLENRSGWSRTKKRSRNLRWLLNDAYPALLILLFPHSQCSRNLSTIRLSFTFFSHFFCFFSRFSHFPRISIRPRRIFFKTLRILPRSPFCSNILRIVREFANSQHFLRCKRDASVEQTPRFSPSVIRDFTREALTLLPSCANPFPPHLYLLSSPSRSAWLPRSRSPFAPHN